MLGQRLLYVHVPLAWVAYLGFGVSVVSAVQWLSGRHSAGARLRASNEVTTAFAAGALATGLAWSYEFALYTPLADPKVLSTVVLVAALAALWTLASTTDGSRRDGLVAALTVVASLTVPASYLASRLASPHPDFAREAESLAGPLWVLLLLATLGFMLLYGGLVAVRARTMRLEEGA